MYVMAKREKTSGSPENLPIALKKATTEMMVLHLLREKPMYTYEMMNAIAERSGGDIVFNTLYLSIYRLEENGYAGLIGFELIPKTTTAQAVRSIAQL